MPWRYGTGSELNYFEPKLKSRLLHSKCSYIFLRYEYVNVHMFFLYHDDHIVKFNMSKPVVLCLLLIRHRRDILPFKVDVVFFLSLEYFKLFV